MGALAGDTELAGNMRNWPTQVNDPFDEQQPSANVQPCITVRHETSGLVKTSTSPLSQEVSPFHKDPSVTNVPAEYN
jgi:hypothetical protein